MSSVCEEILMKPKNRLGWADSWLRDHRSGKSPHGAPHWWYRCGLSTDGSRRQPSRTLIEDVTHGVHAVVNTSRYRDRGAVAIRTDRAAKLTRQTGIRIVTENLCTVNESIEVESHLHVFGPFGNGAPAAPTRNGSTLVAPTTPNRRRCRFGRDRS